MKRSRVFYCWIFLAVCGLLSAYPASPAVQTGALTQVPSAEILAKMFGVPGLPADPEKIVWDEIPALRGKNVVVARGLKGESAFMHHPTIVWFDGWIFAKWNDGYSGEDFPGQRVRYAMSKDGEKWSEPIDLTGRNPTRRFTDCGFWVRDGEMYALAALRDSSHGEETGETPLVLAYKWDSNSQRFGAPKPILADFFAQNVPQRTPAGDWLMLGKGGVGSWGNMKSAKGGVKGLDQWTIRDLPGADILEEPEWYTLPNGHLVAHFRTRLPKRLMRSYSVDSGKTWTNPVVTDFPESGARHHGLRLSNGMYAMLVNPNVEGRIPFSIALSRDGLLYDRIANVRHEKTQPRVEGRAKSPGYHYMRGFEHGGNLYTIYSINKEDIAMTIIPLKELEGMY
jgi:hypothetical protein